jgi:hypothetical protein
MKRNISIEKNLKNIIVEIGTSNEMIIRNLEKEMSKGVNTKIK